MTIKSKLFNKNLIVVYIILLLSIPTLLPLLNKGFFPTHDYIYIARIQQMYQSLLDGQFPVRWVSDFRYGEPLFNFYAPLPYYLGALVRLFGFSYLSVAKILFGFSFVLSALTMYLFSKELFGKYGGVLAAMLYLYAPYRSLDVYVRGALSEAWVFVFFPLIFLFIYKLHKKVTTKHIAGLSLSLSGLFLTHNIMTVLFLPFAGIWMLFLIIRSRNIFLALVYSLAVLLGAGLSATYLFPAFFEKEFIQTQFVTGGYFDFRGHFVALSQLVIPSWGYGASLWGLEDALSLQLGIIHWLAIAFSFVFLLIIFKRKRELNKSMWLFLIFTVLFVGSLFMQHNRSTFIWLSFPVIQYTQFPWRFMAISVFFASLMASFVSSSKAKLPLSILLVALVIAVNIQYFRPETYFLDSVDEHYISEEVLSKNDKLPKDYLPIWVEKTKEEYKDIFPVGKNNITVIEEIRESDFAEYIIQTEEETEVSLPITYFPGWQVYLNKESQMIETDPHGRIEVTLQKGETKIEAYFRDTNLRKVSNAISLISFAIIALFLTRKGIKLNES